MKTIKVRELQQKVRETLQAAQKEHVVVTRYGEPVAIVLGIEGYDWEDVYWATNAAFWQTIQQRRQETTTPLPEVRRQLRSHHRPERPQAASEADGREGRT